MTVLQSTSSLGLIKMADFLSGHLLITGPMAKFSWWKHTEGVHKTDPFVFRPQISIFLRAITSEGCRKTIHHRMPEDFFVGFSLPHPFSCCTLFAFWTAPHASTRSGVYVFCTFCVTRKWPKNRFGLENMIGENFQLWMKEIIIQYCIRLYVWLRCKNKLNKDINKTELKQIKE